MDKYILNAFYSTGDERKEFDSLDAAINYAHELLDNSGDENFAGVDVEDEKGEIIYSLFADGLEEKSGVAIHGEKVKSDTSINLYRFKCNGIDATPMSVYGVGVIAL